MKKVLMGGFFDIIQSGQIGMMAIAKLFGDCLVVNISPDNRAREKKGKDRPLFSQKERMFVVSSFRIVDRVSCIPAEDGMTNDEYDIKVIKEIRPDVFFTGADRPEVEKFCDENNIHFVNIAEFSVIDGMHTTDIISKIKGK